MSVLGNQTALNQYVDFFVSAGETGATGDDLFIVPDVSGTAFTIVTGENEPLSTINLPPNLYSAPDNFFFNATVEITSISYSTPPASGYIVVLAGLANDEASYSSLNSVYLTSSLTAVTVTLTTLVANKGSGTEVAIVVSNTLAENITFNYNITDISFVRVNSGGTATLS